MNLKPSTSGIKAPLWVIRRNESNDILRKRTFPRVTVTPAIPSLRDVEIASDLLQRFPHVNPIKNVHRMAINYRSVQANNPEFLLQVAPGGR